jgi:hypothetical protein
MQNLASSSLTAQEPRTIAFYAPSLFKHILRIFDFAPPFSISYLRLRPKHKTFLKVAVFYTLIAVAYAATDCEILNSGIRTISSTDCCTETDEITCVDGRVTEMYVLYYLPSSSNLRGVEGKLPDEIGNITELISIEIAISNLAAGPVPEGIGLCTKLKSINFYLCKLKGKFPVGIRGLKSLGNPSFAKRIVRLELKNNEFTGGIPGLHRKPDTSRIP